MKQQLSTFESIFWGVRDGGIYMCEDLHTSYWEDFEGGYLKSDSMVEKFKALVDTINAWHSREAGLQVRFKEHYFCIGKENLNAHSDLTVIPLRIRWTLDT